jgi:hypothetical protein
MCYGIGIQPYCYHIYWYKTVFYINLQQKHSRSLCRKAEYILYENKENCNVTTLILGSLLKSTKMSTKVLDYSAVFLYTCIKQYGIDKIK